ncbi:MAG: hypothetical protein JRS35_17935 [Deltaproteobacteria bacterium]|nr:hypothetical protein [Deltaproteobacteria bacterium]
MNPAATTLPIQLPVELQEPESKSLTLLELVGSVCDVTDDDDEVVATVLQMLRSGRVRLCGNFRGSSIDELA